MQPWKYWVAAVSLIGAVGFAIGVYQIRASREKDLLSLEPAEVTHPDQPLEGSVVKIPLVLRNESSQSVSVVRAVASCGCIDLRTAGGRRLTKPLPLLPGDALSWEVVVNTAGRSGMSRFGVMVECTLNGTSVPLTSTIDMIIRPSVRTTPDLLAFRDVEPGSEHSGEIRVLDGYPDPGFQIAKALSSAPERMEVRLEPTGVKGIPPAVESWQGASMRVRYRVQVRYKAPQEGRDLRDWVTLLPKDDAAGTLRIPVDCKTRPPRYVLTPSSILLEPRTRGESLRRVIRCAVREDASADLVVLKAPEYIHVTVRNPGPDSRVRLIEIRCVVPAGEGEWMSNDEILFGTGRDNRPTCRLPVTMSLRQ